MPSFAATAADEKYLSFTARTMANQDAPLNGRIRLTNMSSRTQMTGVVHGPGLVVITP